MKTKICRKCCEEKHIKCFSFKDKGVGKRDNWCKECRGRYFKTYYHSRIKADWTRALAKYEQNQKRNIAHRKAFVREYLQRHPCIDCGESDVRVLEFDHVRGNKVANISDMVSSNRVGFRRLEDEIAKCVVRCANCHRRKTQRLEKRPKLTP